MRKKVRSSKGEFRPGSWLVVVYNEARVALLYDDASRSEIEATEVKSSGARYLENWAFKLSGVLVVYELVQDDPVIVEVVVGPPMTPREEQQALWRPPQRAMLRLPSGRLCVDSPSTVEMGPFDGVDGEVGGGALLRVPKGNYLLTLHRLNRLAMQLSDRRWKYRGPDDVITLTPLGSGETVPPAAGVLRFPETDGRGKVIISSKRGSRPT